MMCLSCPYRVICRYYSVFDCKLIIGVLGVALGDILRELLDEKDITQKQLADSINISASALGNYIQNTREPDYSTLKDVADFFNVSTDYLLDHRCNQTVSHQEDVLLHIFRSLTEEQRELFIEQGKVFIAHNNKKSAPPVYNTPKNKPD